MSASSIKANYAKGILDEINRLDGLDATSEKDKDKLLVSLEKCFGSLKELTNDPEYLYLKQRYDVVYEKISGCEIDFNKFLSKSQNPPSQKHVDENLNQLGIERELAKHGYCTKQDLEGLVKTGSLSSIKEGLYGAYLEIQEEDKLIDKELELCRLDLELSRLEPDLDVISCNGGCSNAAFDQITRDNNDKLAALFQFAESDSEEESSSISSSTDSDDEVTMGVEEFLNNDSVKGNNETGKSLTESFKEFTVQQDETYFKNLGISAKKQVNMPSLELEQAVDHSEEEDENILFSVQNIKSIKESPGMGDIHEIIDDEAIREIIESEIRARQEINEADKYENEVIALDK